MAESVKKTDSATAASRGKKGRIRNQKYDKIAKNKEILFRLSRHKKKVSIIAVEIIINIFFGLGLLAIINYADNNNCKSVVLHFIADSMSQIFFCEVIIPVIVAFCKSIKKKRIELYLWLCVTLGVMIFALLVLCVMGYVKVEAAISEIQETQKNEKIVEKENNSVWSGNEVPIATIEDIYYRIDNDPYMDKILWEEYCGEDYVQHLYTIKAQVLYNNLEQNKPEGNSSMNYNNLLETADGQYESYLFQKKYAEERGDENDILFSDRIDDLQRSLDNRESADGECENPVNERCLAAGYKDKGDEYFGRKSQNEAITAYEKSAEWCMKSIYHAAAEEDYQEMQKCMELLRKLNVEVGKLNEISQTRRERINEMFEVYECFVDMVINAQDTD